MESLTERFHSLSDINACTMVVKVCVVGDMEIVQFFSDNNYTGLITESLRATQWNAAMLRASEFDQYEILEKLLSDPYYAKHIDIHHQNDTALIKACKKCHFKCVEVFLKHGAHVNGCENPEGVYYNKKMDRGFYGKPLH